MTVDPSRLRSALVEGLIADGALRTERWIHAFLSVPRHEFLRSFLTTEDGVTYVPAASMAEAERLRLIYADDAWVTQLDGDISGTQMTGAPTSSSSAPGLMAQMLEALDAADTSRVLELGTGTGYNTALLCAGLSDSQVASVEIDTDLAERAREVLTGLGYRPGLYTADGDTSPAAYAGRWDRLIVTYGVPRIPEQWLSLVTSGGVIVASLYREQPVGAMVRLTIEGPERAVGRFLPFYGGFMPTRPRCDVGDLQSARRAAGGAGRDSTLPALTFGLATEPWQFYTALALGDLQHALVVDKEGRQEYWLLAADGSWACQQSLPDGRIRIREGGGRLLWTELEAVYQQWVQLGKPERERFGLTITPDRHQIWLDDPEHIVADI